MTDDPDFGVYRDLMRLKPEGLSPNAWAIKAGVNRTVWADMRRHGNPSRPTLEKLLATIGRTIAQFEAFRVSQDAMHEGVSGTVLADARGIPWRPARLPPVPLIATEMDGEWAGAGSLIEQVAIWPGHILGEIVRPESLAGHGEAYALTVMGDSMEPRFYPGRHILVSPMVPIEIGDDVVVQLRPDNPPENRSVQVLIKQIVQRNAAFIELHQHKPAKNFKVDAGNISAIHKVIGEVY